MSATAPTLLDRTGAQRRSQFAQVFTFALTGVATIIVCLPVIVVSVYVTSQGASGLSWEFLTQGPIRDAREGGIFPVIVLTMYTLILVLLMAVPIGVASAVFLSEYSRPGPLLRFINLTIVNLAGIPSIVYGLFGAALFLDVLGGSRALWVVAATLAMQALAIIITSSREALQAVPQEIRHGSLAVGVSRLRTTAFITLPQAMPGIITGVLLSISRAAGETAPVLIVGAVIATNATLNPVGAADGRGQFLAFELYARITQGLGFPDERKWAIALVLLVVVLLFNLSALFLRARIGTVRSY